MREATIFELIERLQAAPLEEGGWARALDALRDTFEAAWAHVALVDPASGRAPFRVIRAPDPRRAEEYLQVWWKEDPWLEPSLAQPEGGVGASEEILAPEALRRTRFYREWLQPQGIEGGMGALLERTAGGRVAILAMLRRPGRERYGEPELAVLRRLVPHVRLALRTEERLGQLAQRRAVSEGLLERLGLAAWLLEEGGRVAWSNEMARAMMARGDVLTEEEGGLRAVPEAAADALDAAVAAATRAEAPRGGLVRLSAEDGSRTTLSLWTVPHARGWQGPTMALAVAKPVEGHRDLSEDVVARVYGLTGAEAAVAVAVARGESVQEIARARGVATETVRGQLKAALAKTGCRRQVDLVRKLLAGPAGWPDPTA